MPIDLVLAHVAVFAVCLLVILPAVHHARSHSGVNADRTVARPARSRKSM